MNNTLLSYYRKDLVDSFYACPIDQFYENLENHEESLKSRKSSNISTDSTISDDESSLINVAQVKPKFSSFLKEKWQKTVEKHQKNSFAQMFKK